MSYDKPNRIKYSFGIFDFGGAVNETFSIQGPKGKRGRVWDYGVEGVTEVFAGSTNTPGASVGTPADPDAYGEEFDFGALADNSAKSVRSSTDPGAARDAYLLPNKPIPADQEVVLTAIASTGTPTGMGVPFVIIDWED